jgi:hypothetical protein
MSDDTPTQRFPNAEGDLPTQRLDAADVREDLHEEKQKSRGLLIGLISAGALLLVAVIVLVVFLLGANAQSPTALPSSTATPGETATPAPSASETPSGEPTPTAEPDEPDEPEQPQATGADFTSFQPKKEVSCSKGGPGFTPDPPRIQISWATVRADSAWIVQGTSDAADSGFMQIPLNGNQNDFQYTLSFPCFAADATYTITLVGSDGQHVSRNWTVKNVGDKD